MEDANAVRAFEAAGHGPGVPVGHGHAGARARGGAPDGELHPGEWGLFWFGLVFTWVASGDAMILWMIRGVSPDTVVEDHPERAGCWVVREGVGDAARDEDPVGAE